MTARQDIDQVESWLDQIRQLVPILDDVVDALLSAPSQGMSLSGIHGSTPGSVTERSALRLREISAIHDDIAELARDWHWRNSQLDGSPHLWLASRLAWARQNRAPHEYEEHIQSIYRRIVDFTHQREESSGRLCPGCGESILRITSEGNLSCQTCDTIRDSDEVDALVFARLIALDTRLAANEVAKILGLSRHTVNSWIRRGQLETDDDRLVSVREVRQLLARKGN